MEQISVASENLNGFSTNKKVVEFVEGLENCVPFLLESAPVKVRFYKRSTYNIESFV